MAEAKKKTYRLDLFKQTLPAIHRGEADFYASCSEDERKEISPLILMRWLTMMNDPSLEDHYIQSVNAYVNVDFWDLSRHPELQWKLLCTIGSGKSPHKHNQWFMASKPKTTGKIDRVLLKLNPSLNDQELNMLRARLTRDSLKQLLKQLGWPDSEIKPLMDEFKRMATNEAAK